MQIEVYDVAGRRVRVLVNDVRTGRAAPYSTEWDGRDNAGQIAGSGVYFYRLVAPGVSETRKMVLLKRLASAFRPAVPGDPVPIPFLVNVNMRDWPTVDACDA